MLKLSDELKSAIVQMPSTEKNKLLLRLIAKDEKLVKQLTFRLLEFGETLDKRVDAIRRLINSEMTRSGADGFTPGYLLMEMRYLNARITDHVRTTKDKLGEVTLTVLYLHQAFRRHLPMLKSFSSSRTRTFTKYVINRLKTLLPKASKLHEDYYIEFGEQLQEVLDYVYNFEPTARVAKEVGILREWRR